MPFRLIHVDRDVSVVLDLDAEQELRLVRLLDPSDQLGPDSAEVSARLVSTIVAAIDSKSLPPTDKQIKYALTIARELSLGLPAEVIQYREAMTSFLSMHAERTRAKAKPS